MRVAVSTYGDIEPMAGLAVQLRTGGAGVHVCAPADSAALVGNVGGERVPAGVWR